MKTSCSPYTLLFANQGSADDNVLDSCSNALIDVVFSRVHSASSTNWIEGCDYDNGRAQGRRQHARNDDDNKYIVAIVNAIFINCVSYHWHINLYIITSLRYHRYASYASFTKKWAIRLGSCMVSDENLISGDPRNAEKTIAEKMVVKRKKMWCEWRHCCPATREIAWWLLSGRLSSFQPVLNHLHFLRGR